MDTKPPGSQQPTTTPARRSRERGARTASQHSSSLTPTEHMPRPPAQPQNIPSLSALPAISSAPCALRRLLARTHENLRWSP
jgi:hypothetical protein